MTNPLFSIVVPCYNKGDYIGDTIKSIINQTYQNWECIIVDDGSIDHSAQISIRFCDTDPRIKYYYKNNSGVADTRNKGIDLATGEYIMFLDADDLLAPRKIESALTVFSTIPQTQVVYSNYAFVYNNDFSYASPSVCRVKLKNDFYIDIIKYWDSILLIPIHSCIYRKTLLNDHDIRFSPTLQNKEDWDFLIEVAKVTKAFFYINQPLCFYRIIHNSRSTERCTMALGTDQVFHKQLNHKTINAIAFNLRYRIIRSKLFRLLYGKQNGEKIDSYSITNTQGFITRYYCNTFFALWIIIRYKLLAKYIKHS